MKCAPNINILIDIRGNLDQGPKFSRFLDFCCISSIFDISTLLSKSFEKRHMLTVYHKLYGNIGMIVVYENQAELPAKDVNYYDYAQLFDLHPLTFSGNFQEKKSNVHWICH